ncbi:hypothetical protein ZWY2020_002699 [Hordeum vulgare]|nr:hypothetical protein ZWY2020_002699 [Hordeum vulgare]
MEFSSSEDRELVEDFIDVEDDTCTADVDQPPGVMTSHVHCIDPSEGSMSTAGNELLLVADELGKNAEPYLGMEFASDAAARAFYNEYALVLGFGIRVARSRSERRKGTEVLVMKRFVCMKEGHHKKKKDVDSSDKKKRKRLSIREGCPAMMEVVRRAPEKWVITKLVLEHTHVIVSPDKVREVQLLHLSGKEHADTLQEVQESPYEAKYYVERDGDPPTRHTVVYNGAEEKCWPSDECWLLLLLLLAMSQHKTLVSDLCWKGCSLESGRCHFLKTIDSSSSRSSNACHQQVESAGVPPGFGSRFVRHDDDSRF